MLVLFCHQMLMKHPLYSEHIAHAQAITMNGVRGRWGKMPQGVTHLLPSWGLELHLWSTWWKERTDTHKLYSDSHAHKGNSSSRAHVQKHTHPQTPKYTDKCSNKEEKNQRHLLSVGLSTLNLCGSMMSQTQVLTLLIQRRTIGRTEEAVDGG